MDHLSYNRLAARVLTLEAENKRLRRLIVNNFRLICKIGVETGVLSDEAVKGALERMEECNSHSSFLFRNTPKTVTSACELLRKELLVRGISLVIFWNIFLGFKMTLIPLSGKL